MAILKNKNGHYGPGEMNDMSFLHEQNGGRKKVTWFELHTLSGDSMKDHSSFREHTAHMTAFRKLHNIIQHTGTACLMEEPTIFVDADLIENGGSRNLLQDQVRLFGFPENKASTHQFSLS